jgi:hypothetical protein
MVMDWDSEAEYKELTRCFLRVWLIVKTLIVGLITDSFEVTVVIFMWSETLSSFCMVRFLICMQTDKTP